MTATNNKLVEQLMGIQKKLNSAISFAQKNAECNPLVTNEIYKISLRLAYLLERILSREQEIKFDDTELFTF